MANQGFRSRGSVNTTAIRADHVVHFVDGAGGVPGGLALFLRRNACYAQQADLLFLLVP
jgi:hypothetical protein